VLLSVVDNADHVYRERFLCEKYGVDFAGPEPVKLDLAEEYDVIDVAEILGGEQDDYRESKEAEPQNPHAADGFILAENGPLGVEAAPEPDTASPHGEHGRPS
jgi:hypothetical protein